MLCDECQYAPTDQHTLKCSVCGHEKIPEITSLPHAEPSPLQVMIACSLYAYNVSPAERAKKLYDHFNGECADLSTVVEWLNGKYQQYWPTEMPLEMAATYTQQALERYGDEARDRILAHTIRHTLRG